MSLIGSVTRLLRRLKAGEASALGRLLQRFRPLMLARAGQRLRQASGPVADEEDVAQQAALAFWEGVRDERWPRLNNRHDLVAVLTRITECRAINQLQYDQAQLRDARRLLGDSGL